MDGFLPILSTGRAGSDNGTQAYIQREAGESPHIWDSTVFVHSFHSPYYYYDSHILFILNA